MAAVFVVKRTLLTVFIQTRIGSSHLGVGPLRAMVGFVVFQGEPPAGKDTWFLDLHVGASLSQRLCWALGAVAGVGGGEEGPLRRKDPGLAFELERRAF